MGQNDPVNKAQFDKWARRTEGIVKKAVEAILENMKWQLKAYMERVVNQAITDERAALHKMIRKEIARRLSTPELKELVGHLFEQELGRQDPDAINVEVIDGLFTGTKAKRDVDGNNPK